MLQRTLALLPYPNFMSLGGDVVSGDEQSQCFADFFEQKVLKIVENTKVDDQV